MKEFIKITLFCLFFLLSFSTYGQLGFCSGSKGDPVFKENFGSGLGYGPQLPAGTTNYVYVGGGFPQDGQYTLNYRTNLIPNSQNWLFSLDHTPDTEIDGTNGKSLIVNASYNSGEFFKRTVTGLCVNTTFEFSAWVMNIYNSASGGCPGSGIPINIRFEIWNDTETTLLQSGNTGDINGTPTPIWRQYGLVFTTTNQTSVILKMKNNGVGGCGNDLAIDDIMFRSCGDLTVITSPSATGSSYSVCRENSPINITLQATTTGSASYFYQWQESTDNITWVDIPGQNSATYNTPGITSQKYYRTKVAQDIANLNNNFCSTLSDVFTVSILPAPNAPVNDGDKTICSNQAIPTLSVTADPNLTVSWYDSPTGGNLLLSNSLTYTPTSAGIFYVETVSLGNNCKSLTRTPVKLTITPVPTASISGPTSVCSGGNATVTISGTPNATVLYTVNGGANQTRTLDATGTASITATNITTATTYALVSVTNGCNVTLSNSLTIAITPAPTASISGPTNVCSGGNATVTISGTPNATVLYTVNGGANQTRTLNATGTASITATNITTATTYALVSVTNGCSVTLLNSLTIAITPAPTASISGPTSVCSGGNATVTISGTPNATVLYTVNGGANQTRTLDATGTASITATNITTATTYALVSVTNGCSVTLLNSLTIAITPAPTASISGPTSVCSGGNATVTISGTPNSTVLYTVNGGANQTRTLNATGTASITATNITTATTYALVSVTNGCSVTLLNSLTIAITPAPTASISGPTSVCSGGNATVTISGTPNATVLYTVNGGANQTRTLNATGTASITATNITTATTYALVSVTNGCSVTLLNSLTIAITPAPTASISGPTNVCSGGNATVTISGTPNATVLYTVNGGANQTRTLDITGTASISATNITTATTYALVSVTNGCNVTLSNSLTIAITPAPTASISGPTSVCSGGNATVTISGTPNATVLYTVNGGANHTRTLDATGTASITATNITTATTYALVSVTNGCSVTLLNSLTIAITPAPTASISGPTNVCSGGNATVTISGTPNATVLYTVNGGANQTRTLDATGTASITATNITTATTYALVSVTNGCSVTLMNSLTFAITPAPTASISGPTSVCSGGNATVTISGTPNATVLYTVNGGANQTRTLNAAGTASITATNITTATTYALVSVSNGICQKILSQSIIVIVKPTPTANFSGLTNYCTGETTAIAISSPTTGTTFSWTTLQNGTSGASNGIGNIISQTLTVNNIVGYVNYTISPTLNGCSGNSLAIPVTVNPKPAPAITDGLICRDNTTNLAIQPYVLNTYLNNTTHSFEWYWNGNLITTATSSSLAVDQIGTYSVIATNTITGCVSQEIFANVTELVQADNLTISQSSAFSDNSIVTVTVNGGQGPFLYQLDNGPFQISNVFENVPFGTHIINVINSIGCTNLSTLVTVINYPQYFTPNDDSFNDTWNIKGVNIDAKIYIFDRYGKLLKQIGTNGNGWDGTYNGHKMPADDYWFSINYKDSDGLEKTFNAHFTLKR